MNPRISIIMPVHNGGEYLRKALESILHQTLGDLEVIIIDDASTDDSAQVVSLFSDKRIRMVHNAQGKGVAASLNIGLELAKGEYLARMDADDISTPDRLAKQVAFLDAHKSVGVCGTWVHCFDERRSYVLKYPTGADCVKAYLLLGNPLAHPSVCMRACVLRDNGLRYDEGLSAAQDYEFWTRCAEVTEIDNIRESLLRYRIHAKSVSKDRQCESDEHATSVVASQLHKLDRGLSQAQVAFHRRIGHGGGMATREELTTAEEWLKHLLRLNVKKSVWSAKGLSEAAGFIWFRVCQNSTGLGSWLLKCYSQSELSLLYTPSLCEKSMLFARAVTGRLLRRKPAGNLEIWTE